MLENTKISYGLVSRLFHWIMALMMIIMVAVALNMTEMPPGDTKWQLYGLHKATGLLIFILAGFRLWWRARNPVPDLPKDLPEWIRKGADYNTKLLYGIIFLMPITGFVMSSFGGHPISFYGLFMIPPLAEKSPLGAFGHEAHYWISIALYFSFAGHVAAALYHHFIRKDNVLLRMIKQQ